ncbi:MAG: hypothetical protein ACLRZH_05300 [Ruthenibacterium lactatiformans]
MADDKHAGRAFFAGIADRPAGFLMFHVLFPQFKINLRFVRRRELCFGAGFGILVDFTARSLRCAVFLFYWRFFTLTLMDLLLLLLVIAAAVAVYFFCQSRDEGTETPESQKPDGAKSAKP